MTTLNRVVVEWTGSGVVGRSVTVLHYDGSDNAAPPVAGIRAAFAAASALFPNSVSIQVPSSGDRIDDVTGALTGTWSADAVGAVVGTGGPQYAAGVGCCIAWTTGGIVPGKKGPRRLRGRTFLVPLANANYDAQGTILDGAVGVASTLGGAIRGAGPLAIWHRPDNALGIVGNSYGVVSHSVRDKVAFLSSRRD